MKGFFLTAILVVSFSTAFSQHTAKDLFFELGGPGIVSLNYDMRFTAREDGIGGRIGVGGWSYKNDYERFGRLFIPAGLNYLFGKDGKHYFELGAGLTYVQVLDTHPDPSVNGLFDRSFGHLTFGYRLQPANGGFSFRVALNPLFGHGVILPYYAGVSFGYKF